MKIMSQILFPIYNTIIHSTFLKHFQYINSRNIFIESALISLYQSYNYIQYFIIGIYKT